MFNRDDAITASLPTRGAWIEICQADTDFALEWSLPTRGAWIEMLSQKQFEYIAGSLPTRGAWIEIQRKLCDRIRQICRSPRGERGLKSERSREQPGAAGRSPRGERGLKSKTSDSVRDVYMSLPTRGAWIEIISCVVSAYRSKSLPTRGAWIEMQTS